MYKHDTFPSLCKPFTELSLQGAQYNVYKHGIFPSLCKPLSTVTSIYDLASWAKCIICNETFADRKMRCMIFSQLALSGTRGKKRLLSVKSRAASGCSSLPDRPSGGVHHEHTSIQTRYEVIGIKEQGWRIPVEAGIKDSSFDYCSVFTGDSTTKIDDCKGSTDKLRPILHGLQQTHTLMSPCWTKSCNSALWDFEKLIQPPGLKTVTHQSVMFYNNVLNSTRTLKWN